MECSTYRRSVYRKLHYLQHGGNLALYPPMFLPLQWHDKSQSRKNANGTSRLGHRMSYKIVCR